MRVTATFVRTSTERRGKYPWTGISLATGMIVIFTSKQTGTCLAPAATGQHVGHHSGGWHEEGFEPFYGEITIRCERDCISGSSTDGI